MRSTAFTSGQVSLEALLLWAGLAGVIAFTLPALANLLDAQRLLISTHEFESFAEKMNQTISTVSFSSPGTRLSVPVPNVIGLSAEIIDQTLYIDFDHAHFSARKSREIVSRLPLSGNPSFPAHEWVISRLENEIFIESQP